MTTIPAEEEALSRMAARNRSIRIGMYALGFSAAACLGLALYFTNAGAQRAGCLWALLCLGLLGILVMAYGLVVRSEARAIFIDGTLQPRDAILLRRDTMVARSRAVGPALWVLMTILAAAGAALVILSAFGVGVMLR